MNLRRHSARCLLVACLLTAGLPDLLAAVPSQQWDAGDPSNSEQVALEIMNRARANPAAEAVRLRIPNASSPNINEGTSSTFVPVPPLAMNRHLILSARLHCADMHWRNYFAHVSPAPDGKNWTTRMTEAGYTSIGSNGENLAETSGASAAMLQDDLTIDFGFSGRGHRVAILNGNFTEVGVAYKDQYLPGPAVWDSTGQSMLATDFATTTSNRKLITGVVYKDLNSNSFYDVGEGLSGLTVMPSDGTWFAITSTSGGYAIPITTTGSLTLSLKDGSTVLDTQTISPDGTRNVKADFRINRTPATGSRLLFAGSKTIAANGRVLVIVARLGNASSAASVSYATANGSNGLAGTHYTSTSGTLTWGAGDDGIKCLSIPLLAAAATGTHSFSVNLSGANGASIDSLGQSIALTVGTAPSAGSLAFSAATYSANENSGNATITVTRSGGSAGAVSVLCSTSNGSGTAGTNYTAASSTLSWADGASGDRTFTVTLINNNLADGNKTINLTLTSPSGGAVLASPSTAVLTSLDAGLPPGPGEVAFSAASHSVVETAGTASIAVRRSGGSLGAASVSYATAAGTAVAGTHFTHASGTLNWANGDAADKLIAVPLIDDGVIGPAGTVLLSLSGANTATLGSQSTTVLTITDSGNTSRGGGGGSAGGDSGGGCSLGAGLAGLLLLGLAALRRRRA